MPLKKKEKVKLIKQYVTQIIDIKRTWFCDEYNNKYEPMYYYPGGRVGNNELLAEYLFSKPKCMYYKGQILDFTRISFFNDGILINDCNFYNKVIHDDSYGDLYSLGKFTSLALVELFRKIGRNIDSEYELYAFDIVDSESMSNMFYFKTKLFKKALEDVRKEVKNLSKQKVEDVWRQKRLLEELLNKLWEAEDVFTGPYIC